MGIIKKPQRERMKEYVVGLLEDARYPIVSASQSEIVFGSKRPEVYTRNAHLFLVSSKEKTADEFRHNFHMAVRMGDYAAALFYKDGENFHVRLGASAESRMDKSLRRYTLEDRNMMLDLTKWEKFGLNVVSPKQMLVYYQPKTAMLEESLRAYQMDPVILDHEYLEADDWRRNFARGGLSVDYKIARELAPQGTHIRFTPVERNLKILTVIPPRN